MDGLLGDFALPQKTTEQLSSTLAFLQFFIFMMAT